jgi:anti-anti-sigma factor
MEAHMATPNTTDEVLLAVEISEIDGLSAPEFRTLVKSHLAEVTPTHPVTFVLDLSAVTFMSSAGVAVLILAREIVQRRDGRLVLRDVTPPVRRTLELLGIADRFNFD